MAGADSPDSDLRSALLPPENLAGDEKIGIDEMLKRFSGEFGPWQLRHFVFTSLAWTLDAIHTMIMIFADREPPWRCTSGAGSGCRHGPIETVCGLEPGSWEWTGGSTVSTVAEWGLVCEDKFKVGLVQSVFFAGCMVGCGVFGHLSDSILGRKGSLIVVCIMNTLFGCLTAISPTYGVYITLRVLTGLSTGAMGPIAFLLATESIGPTKRGAAGMSVFYFFSVGIVILSGMAYTVRSWRTLYAISTLPTLLFLIFVLPFVSESPRWYLIRRKNCKALEIMRWIAKKNSRYLPDGVSLVLDSDNSGRTDDFIIEKDVSSTIIDVVRSPLTRLRLVLALIINFLCSIVYYGLSLNVVNLKTNLYVSVILNAVAEMPAFLLTMLLLDWYGRKELAMGTMWFSGVFCVIGSLIWNTSKVAAMARMVCGVLGIFGMAAAFNLLLIYSAELFPTTVRNSALGCVQQAVQMGAIAAPMVVVWGEEVPFVVFGVCGVVGGFLAFYLPETLNQPLYDTMDGMENGEKGREVGK